VLLVGASLIAFVRLVREMLRLGDAATAKRRGPGE
jgi:hypothetical protein